MDMLVNGGEAAQVHETGERTFAGSLTCLGCGYSLTLGTVDAIPRCPACGGERFRRHRLFERPTMDVGAIEVAEAPPAWLEELRESLDGPGQYVAYEVAGEPTVLALEDGWTRIGRSGTADIQLDHPTVSRRHALLVRTPGGELRALDDRSLNGLFVNGEKVEWAELEDGDELEIGRYRLYVLEV
jgi:FHA domain/Zinc-ribbon containing domain